jgi:hypothetical protein
MAHVFITHINEHDELALAIKMFLEATIEPPQPLNVFVSSEPGRILPGEDWLQRLKQELTSAKVVIPLLTNSSLKRPWVNLATGAAWITDKKILPIWCEEQFFKGNLPKPYMDWQIVHLPIGAGELWKAVGQYVGLFLKSPPPRMIPLKEMGRLQEVFKRFYKIEAYNAAEDRTETQQPSHVQQDRRAKIEKWRQMVQNVVLELDKIKRGESPPLAGIRSPVAHLLDREKDFSSLKPLLSPSVRGEIYVGMTVIVGATIDSALVLLLDEIAMIEEKWGLR